MPPAGLPIEQVFGEYSLSFLRSFFFFCPAVDVTCEIKGGGHRVPPAGLPIEQVFGEYSLSFLRRDVALFVSTRARDSFRDRRRVPPI